jgi:hypothetical protein
MVGVIDVVFTYVNGEDRVWVAQYERLASTEVDPARCHDHGELGYAVALLVRYAPWVRNICVVHAGEDESHIKSSTRHAVEAAVAGTDHELRWISQHTLVPHYTFSSCVVESYLWQIPQLSEAFLYCNDDMFFARPIPLSVYQRGGDRRSKKPVWWAHISSRPPYVPPANMAQKHCANARALVSRLLPGTSTPTSAMLKYERGVTPFDAPHFPAILTRRACRHVWERVGSMLRQQPLVRTQTTINFQVLATAAMIALGEAIPLSRAEAARRFGIFSVLVECEPEGLRYICEHRPHLCCINSVSNTTINNYTECMDMLLSMKDISPLLAAKQVHTTATPPTPSYIQEVKKL